MKKKTTTKTYSGDEVKRYVGEIKEHFDDKFKIMYEHVEGKFDKIESKFDEFEIRFKSLDHRIEKMFSRLNDLDSSNNNIFQELKEINKKLDGKTNKSEYFALEKRVSQLEAKIDKLSHA